MERVVVIRPSGRVVVAPYLINFQDLLLKSIRVYNVGSQWWRNQGSKRLCVQQNSPGEAITKAPLHLSGDLWVSGRVGAKITRRIHHLRLGKDEWESIQYREKPLNNFVARLGQRSTTHWGEPSVQQFGRLSRKPFSELRGRRSDKPFYTSRQVDGGHNLG